MPAVSSMKCATACPITTPSAQSVPGGSAESVTREAASARPQLYNTGKTPILVVLLLYSALVIYFVRKGAPPRRGYLRSPDCWDGRC